MISSESAPGPVERSFRDEEKEEPEPEIPEVPAGVPPRRKSFRNLEI